MLLLARNFLILIFSVASISCTPHIASTNALPAKIQSDPASMDESILILINEYRKSHGLVPLKMLDAASAQAVAHSKDMADRRTSFGHEDFEKRVKNVSQSTGNVSSAAENVAFGQMSAREVVDGWLHSPGHKKNIEGNYTHTGIGIAKDKEGVLFFTQLFVRL